MIDDRVDISEHVKGICEHLGVTYEMTKCITITPADATIETFVPNENGRPHIDPETGALVREIRTFKVRT